MRYRAKLLSLPPRADRRTGAHTHERGFSLIELAIGLAILAIAAVGMTAVLGKLTEQRKLTESRALIDDVRQAVLGYVATHGRLPCPALAASNGQESVAGVAAGITTCSAQVGFVPAVTLGLPGLDPNGLVTDAWRDGAGTGNGTHLRSLRYAISSLAAPVANALTSAALGAPGSLTRRIDVQTTIDAGQGLFVCRSAAGIGAGVNRCGTAANTLSQNAAAIIWSRGANGNSPADYSADEQQNANWPQARVVISREIAPTDALGGNFDDLVTWIAYPEVADRLLRGGFVQ
ncbi:MAG: type II secretion system protein [Burkholderiaceae bacterium]